MTDRVTFSDPSKAGWYGTLATDGENEIWAGAAYWTGSMWFKNMSRVYAISTEPFETKELAEAWASAQQD